MSDGPKVVKFQPRESERLDAVLRSLADSVAVANEREAIGVHVVLELRDGSFIRVENCDNATFMVGALDVSKARLTEMLLSDLTTHEVPRTGVDDDPDDEEE